MLLQAELHHDGLKSGAIDGPELAVAERAHRGGARAVVEDGQLAEHLAATDHAHHLVAFADLQLAICCRHAQVLQH